MRPKILVVDDEPLVLEVITRMIKEFGYECKAVTSGEEALLALDTDTPDLVLLDIKMPGMDGITVLSRIKKREDLGYIPVIMLTSLGGREEKVTAFSIGADDFIVKPAEKTDLLARIKAHLRLKDYIRELENAEQVLFVIASVIELKDKYTEDHTNRVKEISLKIGKNLGLTPKELEDLKKGALLHDIGKVAIPDQILQKREPLTEEEWEIIKSHVIIGEKICSKLKSLRGALPIIRHHHERWDGKGYPDGLKEHNIPFLAQIVSVADAYDSMRFDRPYRKKLNKEEIIKEFDKNKGKQFSPTLADLIIQLIEEGKL